jgi:hypothetical protein
MAGSSHLDGFKFTAHETYRSNKGLLLFKRLNDCCCHASASGNIRRIMNSADDAAPRDTLRHFSGGSGFLRHKPSNDRRPNGAGTRTSAGVARVSVPNEIERWLDASIIK